MSNDKRSAGVLNRALDRAVRHTRSMWLPINAINLKQIHKHFDCGDYENNREQLVHDICRDSHLFTYCLKELCLLMGTCAVKDPLESICSAELANLQEILCVSATEASTHGLTAASMLQFSRLEEGLVACAATQVFGEKLNIDSPSAGAAAVIHQLGLTLICWNYPGLYEAAAQEITEERSLEVIITERLGFSPATLASALFGVDTLPAYGAALTGAIRAAETLARANQPGIYPTAAADWAYAKEAIISTLGPSGLQTIAAHFTRLSQPLIEVAPSLFQAGLLLNPEVRIAEAQISATKIANPYIAKCRRYIAERLELIYQELRVGAPSPLHTRLLLKQIVPAAGFHSATVFTVDPLTASLVPQLSLSDHRLHEPRNGTEVLLLNEALGTELPVLMRSGGESVAGEVMIAQSLGLSSRYGVLLLTIKPGILDENQAQHLIHVEALALTLTHTLSGR